MKWKSLDHSLLFAGSGDGSSIVRSADRGLRSRLPGSVQCAEALKQEIAELNRLHEARLLRSCGGKVEQALGWRPYLDTLIGQANILDWAHWRSGRGEFFTAVQSAGYARSVFEAPAEGVIR